MFFRVIRWFMTLLLIALVGSFIAAQFITFNQFKDLAAQKVKEATGRNLQIAGDIKLSFYPVLGAKVEKISLSNVLGAEQPYLVSVDKVMVGIKLFPLLHKQVELEKVVLEKPVIHLEKDNSGQGNWEFSKAETASSTSLDNTKSKTPPIRLTGLEIKDGIITYRDDKTAKTMQLAKLNATINLIDLDSLMRVTANAEVQGTPLTLSFTTDSPSALMTEKGSPTSLEVMALGIPAKMEGKISITPTHVSITNLELAVQQMLAKGKLDVVLGGPAAVVNANLDFGEMNLDALKELLAAAPPATPAQPNAGPAPIVAKKSNYIDPEIFKTVQGSVAFSAESIETKSWKLAQPKIRANMGGGIVATAAAGQFSSDTQSPMNITFTTADLVALLKAQGGTFSMTAKSADKDVSGGGTLALVPGLTSLTGANIKFNDQTISGRASLTEKSGDQALDADLTWTKNGRAWQISAKTPALQKLLQPEGAALELALQSGEQKVEIKTNFSNADQVIKLNPIALTSNGGTGKGYVTFDQKNPVPQLTVNLDFTLLDLTPLLSFTQHTNATATTAAAEPTPVTTAPSKDTPLKNLNAQINLRAKQLKAKNLQMGDIDLSADLKDGILNVNLPNSSLYQGKTSLKGQIDGNTSDPKFSITTEGDNVNIGALLIDAMQSNIFAGIAHWKADISGSGFNPPAVYETLNGAGELEVQQGAVSGMDLLQLMSAARADSLPQTGNETNQLHAKGTFTMVKGVIGNNDLVLQSPNLEASGKGGISLPQWQIDYRFEPKIGERRNASKGEKFVGQSIAVIVKGSLDHPKIAPDTKDLIDKGLNMLKGVKSVDRFLAPLGLGGSDTPVANDNSATPPATTQPAETKKKKHNSLDIFHLF